MQGLLKYLRDDGYKTYIVTGGGQDFARQYAERTYGIPQEQVIGTAGALKYGSGGTGVVHDNKTRKDTFVKLGGASARFQLGSAENDVLVIFKTPKAMQAFVDKGWDVTGGAGAGAAAGGKVGGGCQGGSAMGDVQTFTLTKKGLEASLLIGGI
jgi:lipid-binding SYLF domain-containing protein